MEILIVAVMATVNMGIVAGIAITMYLKGIGAAERMVKTVMGAQENMAAATIPMADPISKDEPMMSMDDGWAAFNKKKEEVLKDRPDMADRIAEIEADIRERKTPAMAEGVRGFGS